MFGQFLFGEDIIFVGQEKTFDIIRKLYGSRNGSLFDKDHPSFFSMVFFVFKILSDMSVCNENNKIKGCTVRNHRHQNSLKVVFDTVKLYIRIIG